MAILFALLATSMLGLLTDGKVIDYEVDGGAVPDKYDWDTLWANGAALNSTLRSLQPGDVFVIPKMKHFYLMGGILVANLSSVTLQFDGVLDFSSGPALLNAEEYIKRWPRQNNRVLECLHFETCRNVTFTSTNPDLGLIDGRGEKWWGIPGIGYLARTENRPRLFSIHSSTNILVENLFFKNSPYWTFWADGSDGLEVRFSKIDARRDGSNHHDVIDLTAFNTDGFDVTGNNVWIHDVSVWNQDDSICVKDGSTNMLFERINASGLGLTIGSIGGSTVDNITFRDSYMDHTAKGIYLKFRGPGRISNIVYENIYMDAPSQYAIWIGPAQQSDSRQPCAAHPCSLCWPQIPHAYCNATSGVYENITLRNITVKNAQGSPGVLLASAAAPMINVLFEDVVFINPGAKPFGETYMCENVLSGVATGSTWPVPDCFKNNTLAPSTTQE
eukprot:m.197139 g.197139  ORF g.197139 m.197139 type:complete len:445 (+) comp32648_c4_seq1:21-1355(+)